MKIIKGLFNLLSWIVILIIILYLAAGAPILFGYRPVVVLSGSMEPNYPVGSLTYYRSIAFDQIREGDAITFRAGESLVTHRVVEIDSAQKLLYTKGDHNPTRDNAPVSEDKLVGKTTKIAIPYVGYLAGYGKSIPAIICMILILIISHSLDIVDKKQRRRDETAQME